MNIIPSYFNRSIPYTIVGGDRANSKAVSNQGLSVIILNRGGRFNRNAIFQDFSALGVQEIISVEGPSGAYDVERLSSTFHTVRFLLIKAKISIGEQINIGIEEALGPYVLVVWNDMQIASLPNSVFDFLDRYESICYVPSMRNTKSELMPTLQVPAFFKNKLRVVPLLPKKRNYKSLFPFDYCGIYNREKFLSIEGYDPLLENSYWQKLDFGFRTYMWGEHIDGSLDFSITCNGTMSPEDNTPDSSYTLFFLKNLMPQLRNGKGVLSPLQFIPYLLRTGGGLISRIREFRQVKEWVSLHEDRYVSDARSITEYWEVDEE